MAENKKSVLLYCDIIHTVEELDDVDAGLLFKHYLRYINDQNPEPPSKLIKIVFEPIKQNLKRDLKKWEEKVKVRSKAGKAGAEARWQNITTDGKRIQDIAKMAVNDTVTVKDNVINTKQDKEIYQLVPEINNLLKRKNPNTLDVFFMVKQWVDSDHKNIIPQLRAMKTHYEMNGLTFPTKIETLTTSFMEADWIEKIKDADPERKAERINKSIKDANRREPEPDTIGVSAPGSLD